MVYSFTCPHCQKNFYRQFNLYRHLHRKVPCYAKSIEVEDKKLNCDKCSKIFKSQQALKYHLAHKVCLNKMYVCMLCILSFNFKYEYDNHQQEVHSVMEKDKSDIKEI